MFTVKHVEDNGQESVVSVDSVTFDREANCLRGVRQDVPVLKWTSGHVYVMNEQGKTVAVYNITMATGTVKLTGDQGVQARSIARSATK